MKKAFLIFGLLFAYLTVFSQNQICVDINNSGNEDGSASNPYNSIQKAVDAASSGDIVKVAKGTYNETVQIYQKKIQLLGGYAGNDDYNTANPEANKTIIEGNETAPAILVYIDAYEIQGYLTINGFTIRNAQRGIELIGEYSGFLNNIIIENNIIENNGLQDNSQIGGGIGFEGDNVIIRNNIIRNNKSGRGAAIGRIGGAPENFLIENNIIEHNLGYNDHGGGLCFNGSGTITRNIIEGNKAALDFDYGWGGGILIYNYDTTKVITLSHNIWRHNYAPSRGGAIFIDEAAKVIMKNELIYGNSSDESGSAIYIDADYNNNPSVLYMDNCTVGNNLAAIQTMGASIFVQASITHIENCIFWDNIKDFEFYDDGQAIAQLSVNYTLTQQGYEGIGNINADPLFADHANGDYHLKSTNGRYNPETQQFVNDTENSPAIDTGNPNSDFSNEPQPNGGRINMGCYGNTAEASKSLTTSMFENDKQSWTLFPNPANEYIKINGLAIGANISIIDFLGKTIYATTVANEELTIDTEKLKNGIYFVQISYNNINSHQKLLIRKH